MKIRLLQLGALVVVCLALFQNCGGFSTTNWINSAGSALTLGSASLNEPLVDPASSPNFPVQNLVWYDDDQSPLDGRPVNGGWWTNNPNAPGVVPNDGKQYRTATSLLGTYNPADPNILRQHAYWLSAMGATGVIVDWTNNNYSTLKTYSEQSELTTDALMAEFSKSTPEHPALKVVIAMRLQASDADTAELANHIAFLYSKYPNTNVILDNGTTRSNLPLLEVFTDFAPQDAWMNGPQWADSRFALRFTNGYLIGRGMVDKVGNGDFVKIKKDLPYWNFVENKRNPNDANLYQTLVRQYTFHGEVRTEQSGAWVALAQDGMNWDGISNGTFARSIQPFFTLAPQVLVLNRFNYAIGWYKEPGEGLSTDTATMIEPTQEYGFTIFNQAAQYLSRMRNYATLPPGAIFTSGIDGNRNVMITQSDKPLEYQLSPNAINEAAAWLMVTPTDAQFPVRLTDSSTRQWFIRTRNSFGNSAWYSFSVAVSGQPSAPVSVPVPSQVSVPVVVSSAPSQLATVKIVSALSNKCLDVRGASTQNGAQIQQYDCNGQLQQSWNLVPTGNNYTIVSSLSGKCIDVAGASTSDGAQIQQYDCNGQLQQSWSLVASGGSFQIRSSLSGRCLDITGASTSNGVMPQQFSCNNSLQQVFNFQ